MVLKNTYNMTMEDSNIPISENFNFHTCEDRSYYPNGTLKSLGLYRAGLSEDGHVMYQLHCSYGPALMQWDEYGQIQLSLYYLYGVLCHNVDPVTFGKVPILRRIDKFQMNQKNVIRIILIAAMAGLAITYVTK